MWTHAGNNFIVYILLILIKKEVRIRLEDAILQGPGDLYVLQHNPNVPHFNVQLPNEHVHEGNIMVVDNNGTIHNGMTIACTLHSFHSMQSLMLLILLYDNYHKIFMTMSNNINPNIQPMCIKC